MPYVHKNVVRIETPQLLREYRSSIIHIASLEYDLKLAIYLGHPQIVKEVLAEEMEEYIQYSIMLEKELKERGL